VETWHCALVDCDSDSEKKRVEKFMDFMDIEWLCRSGGLEATVLTSCVV
jgi:hypothetical protein